MAANLVDNVRTALEGYPITSVHGSSDSTVALHWIKGGGSYKHFVTNRVRKIISKDFIEWRHVDTNHNPGDIGSRPVDRLVAVRTRVAAQSREMAKRYSD